jgi:hypothetical protein
MKSFSCLLSICFITTAITTPPPVMAQSSPAEQKAAQENELYPIPERGEEALAARYLDWALTAIHEERFPQAEAFLIRAADYASVSSDLSYLLALVKKELSRPERDVLTAARLALETDRWSLYSRRDARYLEAESLIRLRSYAESLDVLSKLGEDERAAELRLAALSQLHNEAAFNAAMEEAFERYPYNPIFPRILFSKSLKKTIPDDQQRALVDTALKRLPVLLKVDGELIRFAAPFISDIEEARRLVSIWRAPQLSNKEQSSKAEAARRAALLASLPISLEIGLLDEETAINELFDYKAAGNAAPLELDRDVLFSVWRLLRTDDARDMMRGKLSSFSGAITGDENNDGFTDSRAEYKSGVIVSYSRDAGQDGVNELLILFGDGWPVNAELAYMDGAEINAVSVLLVWDVYPALREAVFEGTRYIFRPMEFNYPAVRFETLGGILLPEAGAFDGGFSKQMVLHYTYLMEQPGKNFRGSIEQIECNGGIALSAKEYLDGVLCAETSYKNGQPFLQRIDLDLDGRLETTRRFKLIDGIVLSSEFEAIESDWNGDGFAEYREAQ